MTPGETVAEAMRRGVVQLRRAGVDDPAADARRLLAAALGCDAGRLTVLAAEPLADAAARFAAFLADRSARRPVAQIIGERWFRRHRFRVSADVLDPRPDSETLVEVALERPFARVLDLGTGSGCLLLSLLDECSVATGLGTDISAAALAVARSNARDLGLSPRARFARADWFRGVDGLFDVIVSNPPYVAAAEVAALAPEVRDWEPRIALTDGGDGLSAYRAIAAGARGHLRPGGRLLVEIGPTQAEAVAALFRAAGFAGIATRPDLDGRDRVVSAAV